MEDGTGVDKKVINVLGPLFTMFKEKVAEFDQLRKVYTDDSKIYVKVSLISYIRKNHKFRILWSVEYARILNRSTSDEFLTRAGTARAISAHRN